VKGQAKSVILSERDGSGVLINKIPLISLMAFGSYFSIHAQDPTVAQMKAAPLRTALAEAPALPLKQEPVIIQSPAPDGTLGGRLISVAVDRKAELAYVFIRADQAHQPILVVNRQGRVVRSWGQGLFTIPHNIKVDSQGYVWTTDAGTSKVIKFSPNGKKLMEFVLGDSPTVATGGCAFPASAINGYVDACGTTDIIITQDDRIFVTDGYGKKRVLEYSVNGDRRLREWGGPGTGPGKFMLPHGLAYDGKGVIFVADREGGRIDRFDTNGSYLGEWNILGNPGSIAYARGSLWAVIGVPSPEVPSGQPARRTFWLIRINPSTGKILGKMETTGADFVDVNENGEVIAGVTAGGFFRYSPVR
jgi:DNA-binding beta-propeller fold protein YncE